MPATLVVRKLPGADAILRARTPTSPARRSPYAYTCEIQADAKTEQQSKVRAVWPHSSEMDSIKRALRSLFKRGKKNKTQEQEKSRSAAPPTPAKSPAQQQAQKQPPAAPPKDTPSKSASGAPQIPQIQPTQPLVTGPHNSSVEAVPQEYGAQARAVAGGPAGEASLKREQLPVAPLFPRPTAADNADTRPVSALTEDPPASVPTKEEERVSRDEGVADAVQAAPIEAAAAAPAVTEAQPPHIHSTGEPEGEPVHGTMKENQAPNGTSTIVSPPPVTEPAVRIPPTAQIVEDKIPVDSEPPTMLIKPISTAPGMSATSGPLEDFPEGVYRRSDSIPSVSGSAPLPKSATSPSLTLIQQARAA